MKPLYQVLARAVDQMARCQETGNQEWFSKTSDRVEALVKEYMPAGSGVDAGTSLDLDASTPERLVFNTDFHHMDEHGFYDGWTEHKVTVKASLGWGLDVNVGGRDRNEIKEYLHERFRTALETEVDEYA